MSEWRDIPGYDGWYQVSRMGEVRSWKNGCHNTRAKNPKMLAPFVVKQGKRGRARFVKLTKPNGKHTSVKVVKIVADVWLGGTPEGMVAYHKNGDLNDNCVNNIRFITRRELGKKTGASSTRKPVAKINQDGEIVEVYPSARSAARANYMSYQAVLDRCNGKVKNPFASDGHNYVFDK